MYHSLVTLSATLLGFVLGAIFGIVLALMIVYSAVLERSLLPWIICSQTVPILALAPIFGPADRECSVLDASPAGAKLVTKDGSGILERFELAFFQEASKRRKCEVIRRRGKALGVKFVS